MEMSYNTWIIVEHVLPIAMDPVLLVILNTTIDHVFFITTSTVVVIDMNMYPILTFYFLLYSGLGLHVAWLYELLGN